jgi:hypothetical protein
MNKHNGTNDRAAAGAGTAAAPEVVDRKTWQAQIDALRIIEKAHTREGDAIAAARKRLPMIEVNAAAGLSGANGASRCWTRPSCAMASPRGGTLRRPSTRTALIERVVRTNLESMRRLALMPPSMNALLAMRRRPGRTGRRRAAATSSACES